MSSRGMIDAHEHEEVIASALNILTIVKAKITDDSDMNRTRFNSAAEFRFLLDTYVYQVKQGNLDAFSKLNHEFSPTASLQEHAMTNGWTNEYIILSKRFDNLYMELMKQL